MSCKVYVCGYIVGKWRKDVAPTSFIVYVNVANTMQRTQRIWLPCMKNNCCRGELNPALRNVEWLAKPHVSTTHLPPKQKLVI